MKAALKQMATLGEVSDVLRGELASTSPGAESWRGRGRRGSGPFSTSSSGATTGAAPAQGTGLRRPGRAGRPGIHDPDHALLLPVDRCRAGVGVPGRRRSGCGGTAPPGHPTTGLFTSGVFVDGKPIGVQGLEAEHFRAVRSVETGSWLGRAHQGQGMGREMREAILHLAFAGLEAEEALSGALRTTPPPWPPRVWWGSRRTGRRERRDGCGRTVRFRMGREAWERRRA